LKTEVKEEKDDPFGYQPPEKRVEYYFEVYGVIPELMATVAYCRRGRSELYQRKVIKCPYCPTGTLTDVDIHTHVQLFRNPDKKKIHCQHYLKCDNCKGEVGIILKSS